MAAGETCSTHSKMRESDSLWDLAPQALFRLPWCASSNTEKHIKLVSCLGFVGIQFKLVETCRVLPLRVLSNDWLSWAPQHLAPVYCFHKLVTFTLGLLAGPAKVNSHTCICAEHHTMQWSRPFKFKNVTKGESSHDFHVEIQQAWHSSRSGI